MKDEEYMGFAIDLASKMKGQTMPNPTVGAVVVKDGEIIGIGAHLKAGEPHAEVHALRMAGDKAKGSTVYVTLEPCSHFGKTPPCSNLLIEKQVARVVIASTDPNPLVSGGGIKRLEEAGIKVEVGLLREEAEALNDVFFHFIKTKRPYVTLKAATSLDGKIATAIGDSQWITSEEARLDVHRLRHEHDAILVGIGTVLKDNPSLTTRLPEGGKNPIRIILDTHLRTPIESKVVNDQLAETWIITGNPEKMDVERFTTKGVRIIQMGEEISLTSLLKLLGEEHITSLFVEGGGEVNGSFIREGLINQMILYFAPKVIGGGSRSPSPIGGEGFLRMDDVMELEFKSIEQIGPDLKIVAIPKKGNL